MRPKKFLSSFVVTALLLLTVFGSAPSLASFIDIDQNWAKGPIQALEERGLFDDLFGEEFLPQAPMTHELALELVKQSFQLSSEEIVKLDTWLNGLLVSHAEGITRGEFATLLGNVLGLGENTAGPADLYPSFTDLAQDYPGFLGVEMLGRIGIIPNHMVSRFEPYRLITRGEVAYILDQALRLERVEGSIAELQENGKVIVVNGLSVRLLNETFYVDETVSRDARLGKGDQVTVVTRRGQALLVKFQEQSTSQALLDGLNKLAATLADTLTPEQINALVTGDWDLLGEEVRYQVYEELVNRGIAPWEADALIKQDWSNLQVMAQDRLTQEAADYLHVAPELIHAAVNQDWSKLLEYAQVEMAQRLLTSDWLKGTNRN